MYTLFGANGSGSAAIEIALVSCGVGVRRVAACSWEQGSEREELARHNPLMQVPTLLLPDASVMTEAAAILTYLGLEFPASGLLATDPGERSQQLRGLVYIAANCYPSIGVIDYPERWLPAGDAAQLETLVNGAIRRLHQQWDTFSDIFDATPAWRPESPGALEILAWVVTHWSGAREHLRVSRPTFHAALVTMDRHPLIHTIGQAHFPA